MIVVFSTSLNRDSRSRVLAQRALNELKGRDVECQWIDLSQLPLPPCDAGECYEHPNVVQAAAAIQQADGVLVAGPIYNYDFGSPTKNLIELTGKAWTDKVVGFLCAAGGQGSYMAPMQLANSLMLDFRSLILPRFVYATGDAFQGNEISDVTIENRVVQLVEQMLRVSQVTANTD